MEKTPKKSSKPTIQDRAFACCPNCGGIPQRTGKRGPAPLYCNKACKTEAENRALVRGKAVVRWAQAWRIDRGSGEIAQGAFQQFCSILDMFNAEDNEAGRPRADVWAATVLTSKTNFFDRQKR